MKAVNYVSVTYSFSSLLGVYLVEGTCTAFSEEVLPMDTAYMLRNREYINRTASGDN
jgi:hypothetical protein